MARKLIAVAGFLLCAFFSYAQSFWDGGAALFRGDSAFESGFYIASNSFAIGTEVEVENLETGKKTTAIVSQRIDGQTDLLALLSPKAASGVGITAGQITSVRITLKSTAAAAERALAKDQPYNTDSDRNPAAGLTEAQRTPPAQTTTTTAQTTTSAPQTTARGTVESLPKTQAAQKTQGMPVLAQTPEAPAETPAAQQAAQTAQQTPPQQQASQEDLLEQFSSRNPQKQLFLPPREDQKFAYQAPAAQTAAEQPQTAQPDLPTVNSLEPSAPAAAAPPAVNLAEASPPEESGAVVETQPDVPVVNSLEPSAPAAAAPPAVGLAEATPPEEAGAEAETQPDIPIMSSLEQSVSPAQTAPEIALAEAALQTDMNPDLEGTLGPASAPAPTGALALGNPPIPGEPGETVEAPPVVTELSGPSPTPPEAAPAQTLITLEPTAPKPPEAAQAQPVQTSQPATAVIPPVGAKAVYYVQLGAYANEKQARDRASLIPASYPVNIVGPGTQAGRIYRILLGPLNRAESGTMLYWFKVSGFPDAFIKQSE
jgi:cell division protein FtsN